MAMRDGDLPAAFFASVDSRIWCADPRIMEGIEFVAVIERQQSQKFIGCHLSFKHCLSSTSHKCGASLFAYSVKVLMLRSWTKKRLSD
jgi:hypothetical protein